MKKDKLTNEKQAEVSWNSITILRAASQIRKETALVQVETKCMRQKYSRMNLGGD